MASEWNFIALENVVAGYADSIPGLGELLEKKYEPFITHAFNATSKDTKERNEALMNLGELRGYIKENLKESEDKIHVFFSEMMNVIYAELNRQASDFG